MVAFVLLFVHSSTYLLGNKPGCQAVGHSCGEPTVHCQKRPVFYGSCQGSLWHLLSTITNHCFHADAFSFCSHPDLRRYYTRQPVCYASHQATSCNVTRPYICGTSLVAFAWHMAAIMLSDIWFCSLYGGQSCMLPARAKSSNIAAMTCKIPGSEEHCL